MTRHLLQIKYKIERRTNDQATILPTKSMQHPYFLHCFFIGYFYQTFMKLKSNRMNHEEKGVELVANSNKSQERKILWQSAI
jgi:hypothetical protein